MGSEMCIRDREWTWAEGSWLQLIFTSLHHRQRHAIPYNAPCQERVTHCAAGPAVRVHCVAAEGAGSVRGHRTLRYRGLANARETGRLPLERGGPARPSTEGASRTRRGTSHPRRAVNLSGKADRGKNLLQAWHAPCLSFFALAGVRHVHPRFRCRSAEDLSLIHI